MYDIRLAVADDAAQIAAIYAPIVRDTVISAEERPPSADEMRERIQKTLEWWPWLVADAGGTVLGYVYAGRHRERAAYRWSVDVTAYVAESSRRTGIARTLYASLF
ncbi:GNAT family N-acetyltransferase, partial [bacterium]